MVTEIPLAGLSVHLCKTLYRKRTIPDDLQEMGRFGTEFEMGYIDIVNSQHQAFKGMNRLFLLFAILFGISSSASAQASKEKDEVLKTVQLFFTALEKQDTILLKNILIVEGQSWSVREENDTTKWSGRSFDKSIKRWVNPQYVIHERPLAGVEIKIHQQLATAWVPYELYVGDKFSHCGVDIFTMIRTRSGWKIENLIFTVEPNGCDALKKK